MIRASIIALILSASSAEAHCFRHWYFPRPQEGCGWHGKLRGSVFHLPRARVHEARLEPSKPPPPVIIDYGPIPDLQPWEDLQRIAAIAKLKIELQGARK